MQLEIIQSSLFLEQTSTYHAPPSENTAFCLQESLSRYPIVLGGQRSIANI